METNPVIYFNQRECDNCHEYYGTTTLFHIGIDLCPKCRKELADKPKSSEEIYNGRS